VKQEVPPVLINYSKAAGFSVTAALEIEPLTLICEYVGEVRTAEQTEKSSNDSIFQLLSAESKKDSLDIIPIKRANIGRFFNGVTESNLMDANLRTMRC
jgi:hypothetical protein